jgi:hypothetical protein
MDQLLADLWLNTTSQRVLILSAPDSERDLPKWTFPHPFSLLILACIEFDAHEFSRQNKWQFAASIEMLFFQLSVIRA